MNKMIVALALAVALLVPASAFAHGKVVTAVNFHGNRVTGFNGFAYNKFAFNNVFVAPYPTVYAAPTVIYAQPQVVFTGVATTVTTAPAAYAVPQQITTAVPAVAAAPAYVAPAIATPYAVPAVTYAAPVVTVAQPVYSYATPLLFNNFSYGNRVFATKVVAVNKVFNRAVAVKVGHGSVLRVR